MPQTSLAITWSAAARRGTVARAGRRRFVQPFPKRADSLLERCIPLESTADVSNSVSNRRHLPILNTLESGGYDG